MYATLEELRPLIMDAYAKEQEDNRRKAVEKALKRATSEELLAELAERVRT